MKNNLRTLTIFFMVFFSLVFSPIAHTVKNNEDDPKVALVTGASRGIGFALTKQLLEKGLYVIAVARNIESLQDLGKTYPGHLQIIAADLSTKAGQLSVAPSVAGKAVDFLVHNAAIIEPLGKNALLEATPDEIHRIMEVNVIAPMVLTNQLSSNLKKGSRILMVSSRAGDKVGPGLGLYCITKTALDRYTQSLQLDVPHGVLAASVHPGDIDTDMQGDLRKKDTTEFPWGKFFRAKQGKLTSPEASGKYLTWLLLNTSDREFTRKKHNIYDVSHHAAWTGGQQVLDPF
jgi:NAD(P)-dependent dehydrogenase (short-subunit alcohol dehydrogenase family)